jgi:hypothetical protein
MTTAKFSYNIITFIIMYFLSWQQQQQQRIFPAQTKWPLHKNYALARGSFDTGFEFRFGFPQICPVSAFYKKKLILKVNHVRRAKQHYLRRIDHRALRTKLIVKAGRV